MDSLARPWPPKAGLAPEQDPFFRSKEAEAESLHLSTLEADLAGEEERKAWTLDREWAVALSVILHLLLPTLLLLIPYRPQPKSTEKQPDPMGLVKLLEPPEKSPPIPVHFFPAPGASRDAGKRPLPSDANRRSSGGDINFPKAETPRSRAKEGIQDLAAGKQAEEAASAARKGTGADPSERGDPQEPKSSSYPVSQREASVASAQGLARRGLSGLPGSPLSAITAEDAARAARSASEGGDGGAGFNNDGGFVDNGPLSFDTKNYDWSSYAAEMVRRIKRHWEIPGLAHYGVKGYLIIKFFIRRDGTVEDVRILQPSGSPPYDNAAVMAIRTSNPFKPLPADLNSDREGVTIGFFYNMRPEEVPTWNR